MKDHSHLIESLKRDEEQQDALQNAPQAPCSPSGPFGVPMSFRDFLRLKKEVLEAYQLYLDELEDFRWHQYFSMEEGSSHEDASGQIQLLGYRRLKGGKTLIPSSEWPEALKGLTQEDIEILKL